MKLTVQFVATAAVLVLASRGAHGADVKVIANPSVAMKAVSADDLKDIFLENKDLLGGAHVEPVLLKNGAAHEAFLSEYVGKSDAGLRAYYRSLIFTGKGAIPKDFGSDAEVVAYVAKTRGAIGYVRSTTDTAGVNVLAVK
ncbi:MAG TPA: hypothetical protein VN612_15195 [Acidobacteriaceae bacterium]|nr:hypothetical protein [Acidobacteriaceae bacterium]